MNLSKLAIQKALNNQWQDAADINQEILIESPDNIEALNRLAQAYFNLCKLKNAKKTYSQVLNIDPYNPIAKRNIEKINNLIKNKLKNSPCKSTNFSFIEEPGKTKVIPLIRLGEKTILDQIQPCTELCLHIRSQNISFYVNEKYVGRLPDDISKKLIWLHKRNNRYKAYIKSIEKNKILVFIKEIKKSSKNKNHTSF